MTAHAAAGDGGGAASQTARLAQPAPRTAASCRSCGAPFAPFLSFGRMPIANGFLTPAEFGREYFFDLAVGLCERCSMVQLVEQPAPERMFHDHYAFFSTSSRRMQDHFREFASWVQARHISRRDPFVVEIGSNDGILLRNFAAAGARHVGVEPSRNVGEAAVRAGVRTVFEFFTEELAARIRETDGPADAILAANVMCHIPDLHAVAAGVRRLLAPDGVFVFEDPYLGDIVEKTSYDQIYDEHAFYFSLRSVGALLARHDLEVVDVQAQPVHGGSMRYVVGHRDAHAASPAVAALRRQEEQRGLHLTETFRRFRANVERSRSELVDLLESVARGGRRVVGYGATSKSTTVTNYCGLTPQLVEFMSDTTPIKQGKYSPGAHIPVRPHEAFLERYPDYALLFAWNHAEEVRAKERAFEAAGGRWIEYVPKVGVRP